MTKPEQAADEPRTLFAPEDLAQMGIRHAFTAHPEWECPTQEEVARRCGSVRELVEFMRPRHEHIERQLRDPLRYGWESPGFKRCRKWLAERRSKIKRGVLTLLIQGGNRPGKSEFCAKFTMQTLMQPEKAARCFQQSESVSEVTQQRYVKRYLPPEWRPEGESKGLRTGGTTNVRFSQKGGFSDNRFVLPNKSECEFCFYESNLDSLQGGAFDVIWMDELAPAAWVEDQQFRLLDKNGIMLVSFTAIEGYTDTVALFLDGAVVVEQIEAELLPVRDEKGAIIGHEKVPLVMSCRDEARGVVYFHTKENFYGPYEEMKQQLKNAPREVILTRAYGVAEEKKGRKFTNFDTAVHILHEAGYKRMLQAARQLTWYQVYDPGGGRNPFLQWWAVTALGQWVCMREWPQPGDYIPGIGSDKGVWAMTGDSADGKAGPAQASFKFGVADMSREIHRVEKELAAAAGLPRIDIEARYMDSRGGSAPNATQSGTTTLIELFFELGAEDEKGPDYGRDLSLDFEKASGRQTAGEGLNWIDFIQAKLVPDRATGLAPIMFAHVCRNTIFSMQTWTGEDGQKGKCKDPVDTTKYFCLSDPDYVPPVDERRGGEAWGGYGSRR